MAFDYTVDKTHPIVHVRVWDELTVADHTRYTQRILADPDVPFGYVEIVSFVDIEDFGLEYHEFPIFRREFEQLREKKNQIGTVLIIPSQFHYGMGRMIETMAGDSAQFEFAHNAADAMTIALHMLNHGGASGAGNGDNEHNGDA